MKSTPRDSGVGKPGLRLQFLIVSALCTVTLAGCGQSGELKCPGPQLQSLTGHIQETGDDIRRFGNRFSGNFSENAISEAVASLKAKYPNAGNDAIYNYLVSAYCPIAKRQAVGEADQQAKLTQFGNAVHAVLGD